MNWESIFCALIHKPAHFTNSPPNVGEQCLPTNAGCHTVGTLGSCHGDSASCKLTGTHAVIMKLTQLPK